MSNNMSNLLQTIFLSVGGILVVVSLGAFWRVRQKIQRPEPALLRRLLIRYIIFGGFLLLIPCLLFLLQRFLSWESPSLLLLLYLSVSSIAGIALFFWNSHDIVRTLPGRARDIYPPLGPAIGLLALCILLGYCLVYEIWLFLPIAVPSVDNHSAGVIGGCVEIVVVFSIILYYIFLLVRYRKDKSEKDGMLW